MYPKNWGSPWIRPRSLFSKIFNGLFRVDPVNVLKNLKTIALTVPEIIAIGILGWGSRWLAFGLQRMKVLG